MVNRYLLLLGLMSCLLFSRLGFSQPVADVSDFRASLSAQEQAFLAKHPLIKVGSSPDYPPFTYLSGEHVRGFSIEFMDQLATKLGVRFEYVSDRPWPELVSMFEQKQLDMLGTMIATKNRREFTLFSEPMLHDPVALFVSPGNEILLQDNRLANKCVATGRGTAHAEYLERRYPDIELVFVDDNVERLMFVADGKADGALLSQAVGEFLIDRYLIPGVVSAGTYRDPERLNAYKSLGVRNDWPLFKQIIDKAILSVDPMQLTDLKRRWFGEPSVLRQQFLQQLTADELEVLRKTSRLSFGYFPNQSPVSFSLAGEARGFGVDVIRLLTEITGLHFRFEPLSSAHSADNASSDGIDLIIDHKYAAYSQASKLASKPLVTSPYVLISKTTTPDVASLYQVAPQTLIAVAQDNILPVIRRLYPGMQILLADTRAEAYRLLENDEGQYMLDARHNALSRINKVSRTNFKQAAELPELEEYQSSLHLWLTPQKRNLMTLINKALAVADKQHLPQLRSSWLGIIEPHESLTLQSLGIGLTDAEQAFLAQNSVIRIGSSTNYAPLEFWTSGTAQGYSIDYLNLLSQKLGVAFDYQPYDSWQNLLSDFKTRKLDLVHSLAKSQERQAYSLFSAPFLYEYNALIEREEEDIKNALTAGQPLVLATIKGNVQNTLFEQNYPNVIQRYYESERDIILAIAKGQADFAIMSSYVASYFIRQLFITNLSVDLYSLPELEDNNLIYIGIRDDWPLLHSALVKAQAAVSHDELAPLREKWLSEFQVEKIAIAEILTDTERQYIQQHPVVDIGFVGGHPPIAFIQDGEPKGFLVDYTEQLFAKMNIQVNWYIDRFDLVKMQMDKQKIDLRFGAVGPALTNVSYSDVIFDTPLVAVGRGGAAAIDNVEDLADHRVVLVEGFSESMIYQQRFPHAEVILVNNVESAYQSLLSGQADYFIDNAPHALFVTHDKMSDALHIVREFSVDEYLPLELVFVVAQGRETLLGIINKANDMLMAEKSKLKQHWVDYAKTTDVSRLKAALSSQESQLLRQLSPLKFCLYLPFEPFVTRDQNNKPVGLEVDYGQLIASKLGREAEAIQASSSREALQMLQRQDCHYFPALYANDERMQDFNFSRNYFNFTVSIAYPDGEEDPTQTGSQGKVAYISSIAPMQEMFSAYPRLTFVGYENLNQAFDALKRGEVTGVAHLSWYLQYYLATSKETDVTMSEVAGVAPGFAVASNRANPALSSILNKAVEAVLPQELQSIQKKWTVMYVHNQTDYSLLWQILAGTLLIWCTIIYWLRRIHKLNDALAIAKQDAETSQQKTQLVLSDIQVLLDNAGEGFFTLASDLKVEPIFSAECTHIFADTTKLPGTYVPELLFAHDEHSKNTMIKGLTQALCEQDHTKAAMLLTLLPGKADLPNKKLTLRYQKLEHKQVVMVIVKDVTEKARLAQKVEQEQRQLKAVVSAVKNRKDIIAAMHGFRHFWTSLQSSDDKQAGFPDVCEVYRQIHTFKGTFDQLEMIHLPPQLHQLETQLAGLTGQPRDTAKLKQILNQYDFIQLLEQDLNFFQQVLGDVSFSNEQSYKLAQSQYQYLNELAQHLPDEDLRKQYTEFLYDIGSTQLFSLLKNYPRFVLSLAKRLNKDILPFGIGGDDIKVSGQRWEAFCQSLTHVFRNMVVHGIEFPEQRKVAGKDAHGRIGCHIAKIENTLKLEIFDDGQGIDVEALRQRLLSLFQQHSDEIIAATDTQLMQWIFRSGVSQSSKVDLNAGRGMGLDAVRRCTQELGGKVWVESVYGQSTRFVFEIPIT